VKRVQPVDHVRAAIEDEVLTGCGLLKAGRLAELAGDVRRDGARRSQDVRLERAERGGDKTETAENDETAEDHICLRTYLRRT
jgi:hypothetical protein